ncbi:ThiF family adenylyltransferase, partial [Mycobacterium tuberculosis]
MAYPQRGVSSTLKWPKLMSGPSWEDDAMRAGADAP